MYSHGKKRIIIRPTCPIKTPFRYATLYFRGQVNSSVRVLRDNTMSDDDNDEPIESNNVKKSISLKANVMI